MVLLAEDTIRKFGYNPLDLPRRPGKKVLAKCDECGKVRVLIGCNYRDLCATCSKRKTIIAYNTSWKRQRHVEITDSLKEIIYGELLGDGSIIPTSSISAGYDHTNKHRKYILWLFNLLSSFGLEWNETIYKRKNNSLWKTHLGFQARTYNYPELMKIRRKWYPEGIKIVPKDLELTPTIVKHWHYGDGSLSQTKGYILGRVRLCTNGFTKEDVEFLADKLQELDINARLNKSGSDRCNEYVIAFTDKRSVRNFFTYIGDCDSEIKNIFGYKFISSPSQMKINEFVRIFHTGRPKTIVK